MNGKHISRIICSMVCVLSMSMAGCGESGPRIVPVSGIVLMNGQPLTGYDGFIRVVPSNGRAANGKIDPADGTFSLSTSSKGDGCLVGQHRVSVIVNTMVGMKLLWLIPEHYGDHATSDLTVNIEGETDSLEIQLEGELKPIPKKAGDSGELPEADI